MADQEAPLSYGEQFEVPPKPAWLEQAVEEGLALIAGGAWDLVEEVEPPSPLAPPPTMSRVAKMPDEFIKAGARSPLSNDTPVEVAAQRLARMGTERTPAGATPSTPMPKELQRDLKKKTVMPEDDARPLSGQFARPDGKVSFDWDPVLRTPLPIPDAPIPRFSPEPPAPPKPNRRKQLTIVAGIILGVVALLVLFLIFGK